MAPELLQPMSTAPRDGGDVMVRARDHETFFRVAWDGRRWMSDWIEVVGEFAGWVPMPSIDESDGRSIGVGPRDGV